MCVHVWWSVTLSSLGESNTLHIVKHVTCHLSVPCAPRGRGGRAPARARRRRRWRCGCASAPGASPPAPPQLEPTRYNTLSYCKGSNRTDKPDSHGHTFSLYLARYFIKQPYNCSHSVCRYCVNSLTYFINILLPLWSLIKYHEQYKAKLWPCVSGNRGLNTILNF